MNLFVPISEYPVYRFKLVGAFPGFLSDGNGPTHQSLEDVSIMRGIPNVNVWCPADEADMLIGFKTVLEHPQPFYIRYNNMKPVVEHSTNFEIGKAEIISTGKDVTILTYGFCFSECYKSLNLFTERGVSAGLVNLRTLKPVDFQTILEVTSNSKLIVTVEDHFKKGGLFSVLAECLLEHGQSANVLPISFDEKWFKPATLPDVLEYEGYTAEKLTKKIVNKLNGN